jgi:putative oxidoreductase
VDYNEAQDLALLAMRVSLGLMLAAHGYGKFFTGGRIPGTARWFDSIGMRPGRLHALMAASTEVGAGLLLALGLLHTPAAAGVVGIMTVAGWTVHRHNGFFILNEGWEYVFIIAVMAAGLAMLGPGRWSIDAALGIDDDLDGWLGLLLAAGGGLSTAVAILAAFFRPPPSPQPGPGD